MAKLEEDGSFELQQKRWTELMNLCQTMTDHKMDSTGVELAISNVFDSKKGSMIDVMILNAKELMAVILKLIVLRIDSSNAKMTLEKSFIPGMSGQYDADLLRLKGMIKMREKMAQMGIPTGCKTSPTHFSLRSSRSRAPRHCVAAPVLPQRNTADLEKYNRHRGHHSRGLSSEFKHEAVRRHY